MKRENVLVSEDALARQREFEAKIKEMFTSREAHPWPAWTPSAVSRT